MCQLLYVNVASLEYVTTTTTTTFTLIDRDSRGEERDGNMMKSFQIRGINPSIRLEVWWGWGGIANPFPMQSPMDS